jgi:sugar lactone lactonase YvrE
MVQIPTLYFGLAVCAVAASTVEVSAIGVAGPVAAAAPDLELVADFGWGSQPTGVAVATSGRIFVSFPRWFTNFTGPSVAEVRADGSTVPYPNEELNTWKKGEDGSDKFVCIQSVFIDHYDRLWILDPGNAYLGTAIVDGALPNITKNAPKLMRVNLTTNQVEQTIHFDETVAPIHSYLNDVRVSVDGKWAFMSDSNMGGIKVVNLETHEARVLLGDHPSTHSEANTTPVVEGQPMILTNGQVAAFQSDGIAVIEDELYYHAVTARTLYKIAINLLTDPTKSKSDVEEGVQKVALSGMPDGMVLVGDSDLKGTLYMTAVEKDGIDYLSNDGFNRVLPFLSNELLEWPDSLACAVLDEKGDNYLYVTASQVNTAPFIKDARPRRNPYQLYRAKLP